LILSGKPLSVYEEDFPPKANLEMKLPDFGICYGHQLLAHMERGLVRSSKKSGYCFIDQNL
jgi:GMP synthase-like glutamine amidotransferase